MVGWTDLTALAVAGAVAGLRALPGGEFLCGIRHLGGPPADSQEEGTDGPWAAAIRSLAALPNVTCKLSGAHTSPARASDLRPYYETVLAAFGPDRLMFGTDWPVSALVATYGEVCDLYRELTGQLSSAEQEMIFDGTARRVYQLPD
ncbi:MAG: amidohydrolase family protein [Streptosporangiaceae bacterium]